MLRPNISLLAARARARMDAHTQARTRVHPPTHTTHTHTEYPDVASTSLWDNVKDEVDFQHVAELQADLVGV